MKSFATAVIVTVAFLDVLDVARVIPVLVKSLFQNDTFRNVYCTLGVFHEVKHYDSFKYCLVSMI